LLQDLLADLIEFLSDGKKTDLPETANGQLSRLLEHLRSKRCLLVLDDVETVLRSGELAGQYREGYQGYGELFKRVGEERHQSCLVLISREKPIEISFQAGTTLPVRALRLKGLQKKDAKQLLETKGVSSLMRGSEELIELYRGNPLALKIIATTIQEVFNGDISQFIEQSTLVIGDIIHSVLNQQFERLSPLETRIIYRLAIANRPVSLQELRVELRFFISSLSNLLAALESLKRRSLLEEAQNPRGGEAIFTLQPVLMKYVTKQLIEQICQEIFAVIETHSIDELGLLRSLDLVKEQEQDNVKTIQNYQLLTQIIDGLTMTLSRTSTIEEQLSNLLLMLQGKSPQVVGYAQSNILNLLQVAESELQRL
ncbi:MAG: NB-ARC domain-containing protein, partial [Coleofasciculus sp. S288]|nr:NB-ARC domain-containing protein [Coleofasciculus sp. S288]